MLVGSGYFTEFLGECNGVTRRNARNLISITKFSVNLLNSLSETP